MREEHESAIFPKLVLTSLNFTMESEARVFIREGLAKAGNTVKMYFVELVHLWISQQQNWVFEDSWCIKMVVEIISNLESCRNSRTMLINSAIEAIRLLMANKTLRELVENESFIKKILCIENTEVRNFVMVAVSISETICEELNRINDSSEPISALDALIDNWLASGQYAFVEEIDARLRQSYTTSQVKYYVQGAPPPRRSHRSGNRLAVNLPINLLRLLARHRFGISKLRERVVETLKDHSMQAVYDHDTLFDKRVNIWSISCLLSTDLGCREFGTELMCLLMSNSDSDQVSIKATVFYAVSLVSTCSLGAELVELGGKWRTRREKRREPLKSSAPSSVSSEPTGSREHLLQSLDKLYDFQQPLMVSILKQWIDRTKSDSSYNLTQVWFSYK